MDPDRILNVQNSRRKLAQMKVKEVIELIETSNLSISDNGVMYRTDFDIEYNREVETPVRPDVDTPTIPKTPRTPYKPKRKTKPKAKNEFLDEDMPGWLSFDELGLNFDEI